MPKSDFLNDLANKFDALAQTPMPDPSSPTPVYVSRMHFAEWAAWIREYISEQSNPGELVRCKECRRLSRKEVKKMKKKGGSKGGNKGGKGC